MTLDEDILSIVSDESIRNQSQLMHLLGKKGYQLTQSTLSRHLKKLGVQKVAGRYQAVGQTPAVLPPFTLDEVHPCLIVIRTQPGYAQPLAVLLDQTSVEGIAGSVAGDDTIFIAVHADYQGQLALVADRVKSVLSLLPASRRPAP